MSKESENIVRQWEEQKELQERGGTEGMILKIIRPKSPVRSQARRNQTASRPQRKKK